MRGEALRGRVPAARSRALRFEDWVATEAQRLRGRFPAELTAVEFAVDMLPPEGEGDVALGRVYPAHSRTPAHIVVYRRTIESRSADASECQDLLAAVMAEQVALLLGIEPEDVG